MKIYTSFRYGNSERRVIKHTLMLGILIVNDKSYKYTPLSWMSVVKYKNSFPARELHDALRDNSNNTHPTNSTDFIFC